MTDTPQIQLELVEVYDEERIVERGTAEVTWFARVNDAWVHVSKFPGARSERLSAGAGTVWQSRTELDMPRGAKLMRVESRPQPYARLENPLDYLTRGTPSKARKTRRNYYRVARGGSLEASVDEP